MKPESRRLAEKILPRWVRWRDCSEREKSAGHRKLYNCHCSVLPTPSSRQRRPQFQVCSRTRLAKKELTLSAPLASFAATCVLRHRHFLPNLFSCWVSRDNYVPQNNLNDLFTGDNCNTVLLPNFVYWNYITWSEPTHACAIFQHSNHQMDGWIMYGKVMSIWVKNDSGFGPSCL